MQKETFNIATLTNTDGCFDLQFRKDTRHERTNSPTYYRWKTQFIITLSKEKIALLKKVKQTLGCGAVSTTKNQTRFSVQKLDDIAQKIVPYFKKNLLAGDKKQCFNVWQKAVQIIYHNKGTYLSKWQKQDLLHLIEIHKLCAKYKTKPKAQKWLKMAKLLTTKNEA